MGGILQVDTIKNNNTSTLITQTNATTITVATSGQTIVVPSGVTFNASSASVNLPAINLATGVTGTLPFANGGTGLTALGTAAQVLRVNSGATALEYYTPTVASSDYVLLATTDASASASISFDGYFSSTYKNYKVIISGLKPATDNTEFRVRFRISNSEISTSNYTDTSVSAYIQSNGSTGAGGSGNYNLNRIILFDNADSGASEQSFLECTLFDPLATDSFKNIITTLFSSNDNATQWGIRTSGARLRTSASSALSGLTFAFSSGNIASGNFKLYGIK
jgi:hypothetical protein